jgi:pilus assembly protein CpaB
MVKNPLLMRWILGGAIAVLAIVYVCSGFWGGRAQPDEDRQDTSAVVIADKYIPAFSPIHPEEVSVRNCPKGYIPPGALHSVAELMNENNLPLYSSAVAIPEGQPVTRVLINELGKSHGMASILTPGKVAVSFAVDSVRGVGDWIQPGDTIAIFETRKEGDIRSGLRRRSKLLFSSVRVLAVNRRRLGSAGSSAKSHDDSAEADSGNSVLTVLLNPFEAARLVESREDGRLSALLRPLGDDTPWMLASSGRTHE